MKELLKKLINAKSTPDVGELACANVLADFFLSAGIKPQVDVWDNNRANVIANLESSGQKPALLFVSHLDVVPAGKRGWRSPAFEATEYEGKIFGRGACDMKAGVVAAAAAMTEIFRSKVKLKGDLIFAATAGEEVDSSGIKNFLNSIKNNSQICGAIIPEPTNFELITAHRGLLWLEIKTRGKTAHGSMPHLGINAIESMRLLLNELVHYDDITVEPDKLLGNGSMSINKISGGTATNIVPDSCLVQIDIRSLPTHNHSHIVRDIEKIFSEISSQTPNFQAELNVIRDVAALYTDPDCEFVRGVKQTANKSDVKAAPFATDAPFIARLNIPVIVSGPGNPELCHKPDEFIEIEDLQKAADFFKNIILHFLAE